MRTIAENLDTLQQTLGRLQQILVDADPDYFRKEIPVLDQLVLICGDLRVQIEDLEAERDDAKLQLKPSKETGETVHIKLLPPTATLIVTLKDLSDRIDEILMDWSRTTGSTPGHATTAQDAWGFGEEQP